jgi:hypothetical protein
MLLPLSEPRTNFDSCARSSHLPVSHSRDRVEDSAMLVTGERRTTRAFARPALHVKIELTFGYNLAKQRVLVRVLGYGYMKNGNLIFGLRMPPLADMYGK